MQRSIDRATAGRARPLLYIIPRCAVRHEQDNRICILDIDMQGARSVKSRVLNPMYIYVAPPSMPVLEWLRGRGTEDEDAVRRRMRNAQAEVEYGETSGVPDKVVNDDLEVAFRELAAALRAEFADLPEPYHRHRAAPRAARTRPAKFKSGAADEVRNVPGGLADPMSRAT